MDRTLLLELKYIQRQVSKIACLSLILLISCGKQVNYEEMYSSFTLYENQKIENFTQDLQKNDQAKSIGALINLNQLEVIEDTEEFLRIHLVNSQNLNRYCKKNHFSKQFHYAQCSTFIIGEDEVAMAAHCLGTTGYKSLTQDESENTKNMRIVFNSSTNINNDILKVQQKDIYQIKEVKRFIYIKNIIDLAVVKLDKKIEKIKPLTLAQAKNKDLIYSIGHQLGLSLSQTPNSKVIYKNPFTLYTYLPAFTGSSGAPVFNDTSQQVIGLISSGPSDLIFDRKNKCRKLARYPRKIKYSTIVTPTSLLKKEFTMEELIILEIFGLIDVYNRSQKIKHIEPLEDRYQEMQRIAHDFSYLEKLLTRGYNLEHISFEKVPLIKIIRKSSHKNLSSYIKRTEYIR